MDGNYLAVAGDTHVALLDVRTMKRVGEFMTGHEKPVVSLCVGGGGTCFSGAMDGMVIAQGPLYAIGAASLGKAGVGAAGADVTVNRHLVVQGDLTVSGTTTSVNSTELEISDKKIELGVGAAATTTAAAGGLAALAALIPMASFSSCWRHRFQLRYTSAPRRRRACDAPRRRRPPAMMHATLTYQY